MPLKAMSDTRFDEVNRPHHIKELVELLMDSLSIDTVDNDDLTYCIQALRSIDKELLTAVYIYGMSIYDVTWKYKLGKYNDTERKLKSAQNRLIRMYRAVILE